MGKWAVRVSRAAMLGLAWAAAWIPIGVVAGRLAVGEVEPEHIGGPLYAGFLCGTLFSALTGIAAERLRLADLSLGRAIVWGTVTPVIVSVLPFVLGDRSAEFRWLEYAAAVGGLILLSAASAAASVWFARHAQSDTTAHAA